MADASISFNQIPETVRTPFVYVEFDPSKAMQGPSQQPYRNLIIGQRLPAGEVAALIPTRVTNAAQAAKYFGEGSMLHRMCAALLAGNNWTETHAIALDDDDAGQAATGSMTLGGAVTASGTLSVYIAGSRIRVPVIAGAAVADIAADLAAAINAKTTLPVTAAVDGVTQEQVNITARHKGEVGNSIDVRLNYFDGEELPKGLTVAFSPDSGTSGSPTPPEEVAAAVAGAAAYYGNIDPARPFQTLPLDVVMPPRDDQPGMRLAGGTANPEVDGIWAAIGEEQYNILAAPYTDAYNLESIKTELADRWGPIRMNEGLAFLGAYGAHTELGTLGDAHNSPHLSIMGTGGPFTRQERNLLLYDGVSTTITDANGQVLIERLITTYKESAFGAEDIAYLDVNTVLTLGYLRADFRDYLLRKYPRHKLADDGTRYAPGQAIVTPKLIKSECYVWFRMMEFRGLVEGFDQFKQDLIVSRHDSDPCRLDIYLPPDLINQLRVTAVQLGFRL